MDESPFEPCSSPLLPGPLAEGKHEFRARATDPAGNVDPTPAVVTVLVDLTPPETMIEEGPARFESDSTPTVTFTADEEVASFRCATDSWDFQSCTSPLQLAPLADGDHASGCAPSTGPATSMRQRPMSTSPWTPWGPSTTITSGPTGPTQNASSSFSFDAESDSSLQCAIDQDTASFTSCSGAGSHSPASPLADGAYTFRVKATDAAGTSAVAKRGFTVDRTAPAPPSISTEPGWVAGGPTTPDPWFAAEAA